MRESSVCVGSASSCSFLLLLLLLLLSISLHHCIILRQKYGDADAIRCVAVLFLGLRNELVADEERQQCGVEAGENRHALRSWVNGRVCASY